MDEIEERLGEKFFDLVPQGSFPGGVEPEKITFEVRRAKHVQREGEEEVLLFRTTKRVRFASHGLSDKAILARSVQADRTGFGIRNRRLPNDLAFVPLHGRRDSAFDEAESPFPFASTNAVRAPNGSRRGGNDRLLEVFYPMRRRIYKQFGSGDRFQSLRRRKIVFFRPNRLFWGLIFSTL